MVQEQQVTEHHTLHWMLVEPPAESSNYSKWVSINESAFCVTRDARVVEELVALMGGSRCNEGGQGGEKENGQGDLRSHPPPPFVAGRLPGGSSFYTQASFVQS